MKAGIEIHQRLNTKKLFCNCSSGMINVPVGLLTRKLRAVSGELGLTDQAAIYEHLRSKEFLYQTFPDESCLVELDEEPPREINKNALETSLQVAKALNCDIPDEIHIMRKTVIDGSNTSGFQRTGIVGLSGKLETSFGNVGISSVAIEEESAQIIDKENNKVIYALNRLGIPLVEIATEPDMNSPEQVREVAEKIGLLLRSTGRVKRGIGTIRQDINISINDGNRVEIKGFQDLSTMEDAVKLEVERQENLLKIKDVLTKRDIDFIPPQKVTKHFSNTKNNMLKNALDEGKEVYATILKGFSGLLKTKISGSRTLGKELAEYAISQGTKGMIHTDEDISKYNLTREFSSLKKAIDVREDDIVCIIVEIDDIAERASKAVLSRAEFLSNGIPEETRAPNPDGTSSYMRPLPGGDRMYPETDVPAIRITHDIMDSIEIPESIEDKIIRYANLGLSEPIIDRLLKSDKLHIFEETIESSNPIKTAELLTSTFTALRRDGVNMVKIEDSELKELIENMGSLPNESINDIIIMMAQGKPFSTIVENLEIIDNDDVENIIASIVDDNNALIEEKGEGSFKPLMGIAMKELRGKVSGDKIAEILKRRIKEALSG